MLTPNSCSFLQGDCLDILSTLDADSVDLIVTSPPYADKRKNTYGGIPPDQYVEWFLPRAKQFLRVLKPTGSFVLNIKEGVYDGQRHRYVYRLVDALVAQGWRWVDDYPWIKPNAFPGWWPNRLRDAFEHCYHLSKGRQLKMHPEEVQSLIKGWAAPRIQHLSEQDKSRHLSATGSGASRNVSNWIGRAMVNPDNVNEFDWTVEELSAIRTEVEQFAHWLRSKAAGEPLPSLWEVLQMATECSNKGHSAAFPVSLPDWFVKLFTDPGDLVLDPFAGSGTTGVACKSLKRRCIQIDLLPENCELAKQRWDGERPATKIPEPQTVEEDWLGIKCLPEESSGTRE